MWKCKVSINKIDYADMTFEGLMRAREVYDCGHCNERCSGPDWVK